MTEAKEALARWIGRTGLPDSTVDRVIEELGEVFWLSEREIQELLAPKE